MRRTTDAHDGTDQNHTVLQVFMYNDKQVRTVVGEDGEPRFVAADVCGVLELQNVTEALRGLEEDEKSIFRIADSAGREFPTVILTEPGLYSLVMRSRKPEAKAFKRWITHEVIPAIRKHGGYLTPIMVEEALLNPDVIIRLATDLKAERERRIALEAQVEADAPKVEFYDAVTVADGDISVGQMAKLICQNGFEIGRTEFFAWLREAGYLCKGVGKDWNMPTQRSMVAGWFRVVERNIERENGWKLATTTRVTPRGQQYFIRLFARALRELSSAAESFRRTRPAA